MSENYRQPEINISFNKKYYLNYNS